MRITKKKMRIQYFCCGFLVHISQKQEMNEKSESFRCTNSSQKNCLIFWRNGKTRVYIFVLQKQSFLKHEIP